MNIENKLKLYFKFVILLKNDIILTDLRVEHLLSNLCERS